MTDIFNLTSDNPENTHVFNENAYVKQAPCVVVGHVGEDGIVLDSSIFYPEGGGQPSDTGSLTINGTKLAVVDSSKKMDGQIVLTLEPGSERPTIGAEGTQEINWERRFQHMRLHTALHLLTVALPYPVTGGQISNEKGRLDFNMDGLPMTKEELQDQLNEWVKQDFDVDAIWLPIKQYDTAGSLVKTANVRPPNENGNVRVVRIAKDGNNLDAQACGGTHVSKTSEIGDIIVGKVENKGRNNRRVNLRLG